MAIAPPMRLGSTRTSSSICRPVRVASAFRSAHESGRFVSEPPEFAPNRVVVDDASLVDQKGQEVSQRRARIRTITHAEQHRASLRDGMERAK
jgi:hypothetical protein